MESMPWKRSRNTIESAPSPNATGAPQSSTISVAMRTSAPWVSGLMRAGSSQRLRAFFERLRCFFLQAAFDPERQLASGEKAIQVGDVLQREDRQADRHGAIGNPEA